MRKQITKCFRQGPAGFTLRAVTIEQGAINVKQDNIDLVGAQERNPYGFFVLKYNK